MFYSTLSSILHIRTFSLCNFCTVEQVYYIHTHSQKKARKLFIGRQQIFQQNFYDAKIKNNLLKIIFNLQDLGGASQLKIVCCFNYKILIEKIFKPSSMSDIGKICICLG